MESLPADNQKEKKKKDQCVEQSELEGGDFVTLDQANKVRGTENNASTVAQGDKTTSAHSREGTSALKKENPDSKQYRIQSDSNSLLSQIAKADEKKEDVSTVAEKDEGIGRSKGNSELSDADVGEKEVTIRTPKKRVLFEGEDKLKQVREFEKKDYESDYSELDTPNDNDEQELEKKVLMPYMPGGERSELWVMIDQILQESKTSWLWPRIQPFYDRMNHSKTISKEFALLMIKSARFNKTALIELTRSIASGRIVLDGDEWPLLIKLYRDYAKLSLEQPDYFEVYEANQFQELDGMMEGMDVDKQEDLKIEVDRGFVDSVCTILEGVYLHHKDACQVRDELIVANESIELDGEKKVVDFLEALVGFEFEGHVKKSESNCLEVISKLS